MFEGVSELAVVEEARRVVFLRDPLAPFINNRQQRIGIGAKPAAEDIDRQLLTGRHFKRNPIDFSGEQVARNGDGATKEWSIEGGGPNSLSRDGWRPSTFKPGDEVTMKVHPMRDGSPAGNFIAAKWADGHTLGRWQ